MVAGLGMFHDEILGTGQEFVGRVLRNEADLAWWTLAILAAMKAIATRATLGGRGAGGIFMPSLFIGATTGFAFALLIEPIWGARAIQPGAFALVGMAATFSAVARAPLTSILIVFEVTGDYGLVLPLMVATVISTLLASRVRPESAYSSPLARMGIHPAEAGVTDLLDPVRVGEVVDQHPLTVSPDDSLGDVHSLMQRHRLHGAPVVARGNLLGVIAESDITWAGGPSDQVAARDVMTPNPVTVNRDTPVSEALECMAALGIGRLPRSRRPRSVPPGRHVPRRRRGLGIPPRPRSPGSTREPAGSSQGAHPGRRRVLQAADPARIDCRWTNGR